jgi:hypothetical protein
MVRVTQTTNCFRVAALSLALVLSACGGSDMSSSTASTAAPQQAVAAEVTTSAPTQQVAAQATTSNVSFLTASYPVALESGAVSVTVERAGNASAAVTIDYQTVNGTAVAGTNYEATSGTLSWAENDATPKTISIPLIKSTAFAGTKQFTVALTSPSTEGHIADPDTATVTIAGEATADAGELGLSATSYTIAQMSEWLRVNVNRTAGSGGAASVAFATTNGTAVGGVDFVSTSGTLSWASGDASSKSFLVRVNTAKAFLGKKAFNVVLSKASGAGLTSPSSAPVTIVGAASAAVGDLVFSTATDTVAQNAGKVSITVNRANGSTGAISVAYKTANGTAVSGTNFTAESGTLTWEDGDTSSRSISIPVSNATPFSGSKKFTVALSSPSNGATIGNPGSASVVINGDAAAAVGSLEFAASSYAVAQSAGYVTVSVDRSGGSNGEVSVEYATKGGTAVSGTNFAAVSGTLTWASGDAAPKTFRVPVSTTRTFAGSKSLTIALSNASGGASIASPSSDIVTINGSAASAVGSLQMSAPTYTVVQTAGAATATVMRTGGTSGAVSVQYGTLNGTAMAGAQYTPTSGTLTWANGDASAKSVTVPVEAAPAFSGTKTFHVALSAPSGGASVSDTGSSTVNINGAASTGAASAVPTNVTATVWPYTALVSFSAPTETDGKTISSYSVTATKLNFVVGSGTASPIMVQGVNGIWGSTPTAFTVVANYSDGSHSTASAASNTVSPPGGTAASTSPNVYANGEFYWKGDFDFDGTNAYGDTSGDPEADAAGPGSLDVEWTAPGGGWQPYAPAAAYDLSPYQYMEVDLKASSNNKTWVIYFEKVGDVGVGAQVTLPSDKNGTYGPAAVAGEWVHYKIPLKNMNVGPQTANPIVLKFALCGGPGGSNVWYANNVKFSAN